MMARFLLIFLLVLNVLLVGELDALTVSKVFFNCSPKASCENYVDDFTSDLNKIQSVENIDEVSRRILLNDNIESFSYELINSNEIIGTEDSSITSDKVNSFYKLIFNINHKKILGNVLLSIVSDIDVRPLVKDLERFKGEFFDEALKAHLKGKIFKYFSDLGAGEILLNEQAVEVTAGVVNVNFGVELKNKILIDKVKIFSKYEAKDVLEMRLTKFQKKALNKVELQYVLDRFSDELRTRGHFGVILRYEIVTQTDNQVELQIFLDPGRKININVSGERVFFRSEIVRIVYEAIKANGGVPASAAIENALEKKYRDVGLYGSKFKISIVNGKTIRNTLVTTINVSIDEGVKKPLRDLSFVGVSLKDTEELLLLYRSTATPIAKRGFVDEVFLSKFVDELKKYYLSKGHVLVNVYYPRIIFNDLSADVVYSIDTGPVTVLNKINLFNVKDFDNKDLFTTLVNREGAPLNIPEVENDLKRIHKYFQSKGNLFSEIISTDAQKLVSYSNDYSLAEINVSMEMGKKARLGEIVIVGNDKTKREVVLNEAPFKTGDYITPDALDVFKENLDILGPFASVKITPQIVDISQSDDQYLVNLLVKVKEKNSVIVEFAPGYRTDIGIKTSTSLYFNNVSGKNRSLLFYAQANQRLDQSTLARDRRDIHKNMIEYDGKISYSIPNLLRVKVLSESQFSTSKKRFFGFDATINKFSQKFSKLFADRFLFDCKYQLEDISQFNASSDKDNGYFRIGSVNPGFTFDYKTGEAYNRKGFSTGISYELANKSFGSMSDEDLIINFYRIISRNKLYFPIANDWSWSTSIAIGEEKNLSRDLIFKNGSYQHSGYIPSIKVFRLDGIDNVRGFESEEINRIIHNGAEGDIGSFQVINKAFFLNIKIEPRYQVSDSMVLGPFFDAGKVYIDSFKPYQLRSSFGISFKLLTPVGSIDFDYGVKTNRRVDSDNQKEGFGRFHLSVGLY